MSHIRRSTATTDYYFRTLDRLYNILEHRLVSARTGQPEDVKFDNLAADLSAWNKARFAGHTDAVAEMVTEFVEGGLRNLHILMREQGAA